MNQPTKPDSIELLPLPERVDAMLLLKIPRYIHTPDQMRDYAKANVLADRAHRPAVSQGIDSPEFWGHMRAWNSAYQYGPAERVKDASETLIAHINARLAPAAPSGEAIGYVSKDTILKLLARMGTLAAIVPNKMNGVDVPLYTHSAPKEGTK